MGQHEKEFMSSYDKILMDYTEEVGVDVLSNLTPPKELMVEVRVLQECGEIMTETGSVGDSYVRDARVTSVARINHASGTHRNTPQHHNTTGEPREGESAFAPKGGCGAPRSPGLRGGDQAA